MIPHWELAVRLVVAALLGAAIGYERDTRGRPAGLRTHLIVSLASSLFMVVSTQFAYYQRYAPGDIVSVDPSRIGSYVAAGIGFLGAGAILRTGISVQGLTTAAGLWLVAAIGLAAGAGMYPEGVLATAIGLVALWALRRLEDKDEGGERRKVSLVFDERGSAAGEVARALGAAGIRASPVEYEHRRDERRVMVALHVGIAPADEPRLVEILEAQPGLRSVRVETIA
ncbi:MAG TPA: MgtC/SapB family protein [Methylomirabilota bacterium]|nr:MgtC/SapB family protein [Methylomirabilota bacterium]